jgi:PTS system galactitol-specific IIA component
VCSGVAQRLLAGAAVEQGYARASFVDAVLEREVSFPTGLPLPVPVAIPHADARHILRPGMAALVPQAPLTFGEMGGKVRTVEAQFVLMLLVDQPSEQVVLLGRLIAALRRPDLGEVLLDGLEDAAELVRRFDALLGS